MASACTLKLVTTRALVLALLYLLVLQGVCGCVSGHGCFHEKPAQNRKILHADLKENNGSTTGAGNMENFVGWELRAVPSGPDPLHHNGGSPKKPRTDP
ncbi:hypothetical protein ERO13_A09G098550v2 [Gossypium hirsutum]|uniref:CLAVATA3/ESR-like protein n=1 Tax=Gossypium mustelinum TaxID=34275 RepID=A0A5D2XWA0_GOSMU|nr:hypothetical protein ERO13_A09G098550v2 [Gossypium hirsutum]TYJ18214.1 hypothetical protein E1A91_A09G107400v1 [Gossypium mustelinum]